MLLLSPQAVRDRTPSAPATWGSFSETINVCPVISEYLYKLLSTGSGGIGSDGVAVVSHQQDEGDTQGALAPTGCLTGRHFILRYQIVCLFSPQLVRQMLNIKKPLGIEAYNPGTCSSSNLNIQIIIIFALRFLGDRVYH